MKKQTKNMLIEFARIGITALEGGKMPKKTQDEIDAAKLRLDWINSGLTGDWDEARANPALAEGFAVNPTDKAKVRAKLTKGRKKEEEPATSGVHIPDA